MDRRELVRALGATSLLALFPGTADEVATIVAQWQVAGGQGYSTLTPAQQALVARVADLVLPRTDTPGALDVRVPELIDRLLTRWYDSADTRTMLANIDAIDTAAQARGATGFVALPEGTQVELLQALDAARDDASGAAAGFRALKSLIIFGYFTSERVTKEVLRTRTYFSRYEGNAPVSA